VSSGIEIYRYLVYKGGNYMKVAAYSGNRAVYYKMVPAVKSLLMNSDVDEIYLLIEDNRFPYNLPSKVKYINISNQ